MTRNQQDAGVISRNGASDEPRAQPDAPAGTDASGFIHLHLHTEYSLLDGGNKIDRLVERVKALGMNAVAVTDHGNLFGAVEFYTKARAAGVKPILGIEAYVAPGDRTVKQPNGIADGGFHLVLLAEDLAGWRNLIRLSSDSFTQGFYYKPRMDRSTLQRHAAGLIAINGHLGSSLAHHLQQFAQTSLEAHWAAAVEEASWHRDAFGVNDASQPRFFIELQRVGVQEQDRINPLLVKLARELSIPLVADNDAHFLTAADHDDHDTLCCISMAKTKDDATRLRYPTEVYVKSPQQMAELFTDLPEVIANAAAIAARCNVSLDFSVSHAPLVRVKKLRTPPPFDPKSDPAEWYKQVCACDEVWPVTGEDIAADRDAVVRECNQALARLAEAGLLWRYGSSGITPAIRARLDRELQILADKNISAYFLIVWDFVNWARQRGIPAAARGSGVGTMVGYVLGLSNACPERFGLLFERFTDPNRSEYPDIDIDICQDGRAQVLDYVRKKYGHVAQIVTFGRLKARAAIKDVARVNGFTPAEGQRLANLIPEELNITIDAALQKEPDLKAEYDNSPIARKVINAARAIENHARHIGVHAAGVVIATQPLDEIVPLCRATGSEDFVTQWDGPTCEKVGLMKMDFLGLRTLSTIELARTLIRDSLPDDAVWRAVGLAPQSAQSPAPFEGGGRGVGEATGTQRAAVAPSVIFHPLDLDHVAFDDQKVLDVFRRGDTAGIFQFESGGMRKLLVEMKPDRLEDLIAANALFRPGPMELIPDYCRRKHGTQAVPKAHPVVEQFTAETYGIMVYQEQVMQILHGLGDLSLRDAYSLIKAISKKKSSTIDAERPKFLAGAQARGLNATQANDIFNLILKFAGYGFNKSHSTGYAIIAYQTAYLKTYFPAHYMAALLTYESGAGKVDDWAQLLEEARRLFYPDHSSEHPHIGVEVKPPDVNLSNIDFAVVYLPDEPRDVLHGHVRFGLSAIKGVGRGIVQAILADRSASGSFTSFDDFCDRTAPLGVNRGVIEALIKGGVFDSLHGSTARAALTASIERAVAAGQSAAEDRRAGQMGLFGAPAASQPAASQITAGSPSPPAAKPARPLPTIAPWSMEVTLAAEKEVLGFHVSAHPLDRHDDALRVFCTATTRAASDMRHDSSAIIGGVLSRVRVTMVKNGRSAGEKMAMITLQDRQGSLEGVVFSSIFAKFAAALQVDAAVFIVGRVDRQRGEPQVIVDQVLPIVDAPAFLAGRLELTFIDDPSAGSMDSNLNMALGLLQQAGAANASGHGGRPAEVLLHVCAHGRSVTLKPARLRAVATGHLLQSLRELLGPENVALVSAGIPRRAEPERAWPRRQPAPV